MINSINFPLDAWYRDQAGGWDRLRRKVQKTGCDGIEAIWTGEEIPEDFPKDLLTGYHLTYFPEWIDFYRGDMERVRAHFPLDENLTLAFGGTEPENILKTYQKDFARALRLDPAYMVFHVSEVSNEECFTYRWLHSDEDVIDASVEIINELLKDAEPTFDFLVENQWWPGFTFTDPKKTERLLSGIRYPRTGILLDTGHLMNTNRYLRSQKEGIHYVMEMLDRHGSLSERIRGMHFHQSVSGSYTRKNVGFLPDDYPDEYLAQLNRTYKHILHVDLHHPWTDTDCVQLLERIRPEYLTHEMSGGGSETVYGRVSRQISTIRRGYAQLGKESPV